MPLKWYIVHVYSGFENKVKQALDERIATSPHPEKFGEVLVPTEQVVELVKGKRKESSRKFYPGYILVEMELDDETWHMVKSTPRVTGFVGGKNPVPIPEEEVEIIIQQVEKGPAPQIKTQFQKGESVRIIDGPFSNFNGYVEDLDMDHGRLRVMVSIFGRQTPVELNFFQVEKNT